MEKKKNRRYLNFCAECKRVFRVADYESSVIQFPKFKIADSVLIRFRIAKQTKKKKKKKKNTKNRKFFFLK